MVAPGGIAIVSLLLIIAAPPFSAVINDNL
jgi:Tfp pilus assembly protein FimT